MNRVYSLGRPRGLYLQVCLVGGIWIHLRRNYKTLFLWSRLKMG